MSVRLVLVAAIALLAAPATAFASHIPGMPCTSCASHAAWPSIDGLLLKADVTSVVFVGTARSDELLGHHGSDVLRGRGASDVLWGNFDPNQNGRQVDRIYGGGGTDFIYGSHGRNVIRAGRGNDVINVHFGRGLVSCGPGRDIYHVARSRKHRYRFRGCERVDYRTESQRGGGLKPLR